MLQDKYTALMCVAGRGHTEVVQLLLSRQDVDINMRDKVIFIALDHDLLFIYIQPVMYCNIQY